MSCYFYLNVFFNIYVILVPGLSYSIFSGGTHELHETNKPPLCHLNFEPACPSQNNMPRVFVTAW